MNKILNLPCMYSYSTLIGTKSKSTNEFIEMSEESQNEILNILNNKGVILFPTDTIWGIGCDATQEDAVKKVYDIKNRDINKPLIVLVSSLEMLKDYVESIHPKIETLLMFHERPLTVIYEEGKNLAANVIAKDGSIGIRVVLDEFCKSLIEAFGKPLVSTSANISGQPFPRNFGEISSDILEQVDYVVKIRQNEKSLNTPSIVVKLDDKEELFFIRS